MRKSHFHNVKLRRTMEIYSVHRTENAYLEQEDAGKLIPRSLVF